MDTQTIDEYNKNALEISRVHNQICPKELYKLALLYFKQFESTLDVGCGSGRDVEWFRQHNYPAIGIDASEGMINTANINYPHCSFSIDSLPLLALIKNSLFHNVMCSATLMHLPENYIELTIINLIRVTKPGGTMIVSFRHSSHLNASSNRESGKLYSPLDVINIIDLFEKNKSTLVCFTTNNDLTRQLTWNNLVFKKQ